MHSAIAAAITSRARITIVALLICATPGHGAPKGDVAGHQRELPYRPLWTPEQVDATRRAWTEGLPYIPGDVLFKLREGASLDEGLRALAATAGGADPLDAERIGDVFWLKAVPERDSEAVVSQLVARPDVAWAQANFIRRLTAIPDDPGYPKQWNFDLLDMPRAWDIITTAGDQIVVAVIDTGVTTVTQTFELELWTGGSFERTALPFRINPDLNAGRIMTGRDFIFWNGPVVDMIGHGTHVAGTVLQETNNALGLAGIAHRARLMPLKACLGYWEIQLALADRDVPGFVDPDKAGGCPDAAVAQAIRFAADNGAHIVNLSLGGPEPSPVLFDALEYAVSRGVFVSIAGGNEFNEGNTVAYPARYAVDLEGVVSVAAVGPTAERAYYSNTGAYIELAAPGGDARHGGAAGAIYQVSMYTPDFNASGTLRPRFDRYAETPSQGTSMAAPHVAGLATLIHAQGTTSPAAIERTLKSTARDLGLPGPDIEFGHGLINAPAALRGRGLGVAR